ncbi:MAG: cation transporter [Saprospirales bacterium]|mgnify:FL=1|nr:cation transporter [Saprospirales bacterium]|tara:strand:+ start:676 stop:1344 length:669 start_codon:yes stop_codon:yes gene_type:complete
MSRNNNETKTLCVVVVSAVAMLVEIVYGLTTKSMALLSDGIHMGSHVLAIGLSWFAYFYIRRFASKDKSKVNSDKILSLSGYSSGLLLFLFAVGIMIEAITRIIHPTDIQYTEAMVVACIGLVVNVVSAFLLHHDHEDSDHNIRAAYIHVISDALTSLAAIIGLFCAMKWDIPIIDTLAAIISSLIIMKWSVGLLKDSGAVLVDIKSISKDHKHGHHGHHHH